MRIVKVAIERERLTKHGKRIGIDEIMKQINWICFQHDKVNGAYEYLPSRILSDKVLRHKKITIACNPNWFLINNLQILLFTQEKKFERRQVNLSFRDNIWGADLEDM